MQNRVKTIEVTKAYAKAFNAHDMVMIGDMLDAEKIIFSRQTQSAIVGQQNVLRRIRNLFYRIDKQHHTLKMINAIADLGKVMAQPCLIGLLNGERAALCVLDCKINGKITSISILTGRSVVESARATEEETMD